MSDEVVLAVENLVKERWDRDGRAVLLSNLPAMLSKTLDVRAALGGKKLSARLREPDAVKAVRLVQSPSSPLMWGAVPADADFHDPATIFSAAGVGSSTIDSGPKMYPAVKLAFTRPLAEGMERHLLLDGHVRFQDVLASMGPPEGSKLIPRDSLCAPDATDAEVVARVSAWADDNGVEASRYQRASAARAKAQPRAHGGSLSNFLAELTNEERRRILLPADIVAKFL